MKTKISIISILTLASATFSTHAQNQAKMQTLNAAVAVSEPQGVVNAEQTLQSGQGQPQFADYTQFADVVVGGMTGGQPFFLQSHNVSAADTISTDELSTTGQLRLGLAGAGTTVGMWEIGDPLLTHPEFTDGASTVRVIDKDGPKGGANPLADRWHATHVAGTMVARGANSAAKGMSPDATLNAYDTIDQFTETTALFSNGTTADDLSLSNHSYGLVAGWFSTYTSGGITYPVWNGEATLSTVEDYLFGYYDTNANLIDQITYLQETYLPVWSAGNDRLQPNASNAGNFYVGRVNGTFFIINGVIPQADGFPAGYDSLTGYGLAKNVLSVAAADDITGGWTSAGGVSFASFSSAGPTDDGRIKPDVTANGVAVLSADDPSTSPYNTTQQYFSYSGTSQAAPNVTGSINLLIQYHKQLHGTAANPLASTVKGWVIHTADEAGASAGPDYKGGYGLMNAMRAASLIRANKEALNSPLIKEAQVATGGTYTYTVVALGGQPLKVTVPWTDPAGAVGAAAVDNASLKLINDLDVRVTGPGGVVTLPWILDPANPASAATRADNTRDNVEQVVVDTPTAGATYTITVAPTAGEVLVDETGATAPQKFSLLVSGIKVEHNPDWTMLITPTGATTYELSWTPLPGLSYDFQTSTDLQTWTTLQSNQTFSLTPAYQSVIRNPAEPKRFWRYKTNP